MTGGEWMCPACARPETGLTAPKRVWVPADALDRQAASFVGRRSVLPRGRPAFGVTAGEAAHMRGDCDPDDCARCALIKEMRGEGTG